MSAPETAPRPVGQPRSGGRDRSWAGSGGDAGAVRRRQLVLFSVIAAAVLAVLAAWLSAGGGGGRPPAKGGIEAELAGPDTAEKVWTRRSEARLGTIETRLREMETEARRLEGENERLRRKLAGRAANARGEIDRQAAAIDRLERQLNAPPAAGPSGGAGFLPAAGTPAGAAGTDRAPALRPAPLIETFELEADERGALEPGIGGLAGAPVKPVGLWLPAGAHAEAVVLSGVDASAGVSSQGDPRPVLFRITGPAWTAAPTGNGDGSAIRVDVAGCTVTGAAHGDLSSEKIYARLRTMTCAGPDRDTVIETDVAGFVAGSGKVGVRGPVVSREGALVEKAFLAGVVSGLGQGVSQAFQPQAVASGSGAAVANTGLGDIGRAGLGAGASSAGQKVADYMIRRAEQYQPVIQLRAGTRVTLVFLEGARLDGRADARQAQARQASPNDNAGGN